MKKYTDLEYLRLSKGERFKYRFLSFFAAIPVACWRFILNIGGWFKKAGLAVANEAKDIWTTFVDGDWKAIYNHALDNGFRFLSYGDSSVLFRR